MTQPHLDRLTDKSTPRRAFTLIEMMVAMALTMLLILALTQMFDIVGDNFSQSRAALELSGKMRTVEARLQQDLDGITVPIRPWSDNAHGEGYFEYIEGAWRDSLGTHIANDPMLGDWDDRLGCTRCYRKKTKSSYGKRRFGSEPHSNYPLQN